MGVWGHGEKCNLIFFRWQLLIEEDVVNLSEGLRTSVSGRRHGDVMIGSAVTWCPYGG